jgi:hypothetical protein
MYCRVRTILHFCIIATALAAPVRQSQAAIITLVDNNSVAQIDNGTSAGMFNWSVDGQNQLAQQWFWYRIGSGLQQPINMIGTPTTTSTGPNQMTSVYGGAGFDLSISYLLTGGSSGSGSADIQETIMFHNSSGSPLDFHLYQYSDFNLAGSPGGDTVYIDGSAQTGYNYAIQWKGATQIAEAINLPAGDHAEANTVPNTLNSLNSVNNLILNDATGATGDVSWALQWDATVGAGQDFLVFKDKLLSIDPIPEPSVLALLALGMGLCGVARRRQ